MLHRAVVFCLGAAVVLPTAPSVAAQAQTTAEAAPEARSAPVPSDGGNDRFSFERVGNEFLRLDARTGQVALCSQRQVGWACQLVADDRVVLDSEIAHLQAENGRLKKELLSRGIALPSGILVPAPETAEPRADTPGALHLDPVMNVVSSMWQRLVDMVDNLKRDVMKRS